MQSGITDKQKARSSFQRAVEEIEDAFYEEMLIACRALLASSQCTEQGSRASSDTPRTDQPK